jgi:[acyl-carrier-protein] S-malonyltransferase
MDLTQPYALVFTGQGAQSPGMGNTFQGLTAYEQTLAQADACLGYPLSHIMNHGPVETLMRTEHAQPALLALGVALWRVWQNNAPTPAAVAGHSLGEYTALVAAEVLNFETALNLVKLRSQLMQQACEAQPGGMAAVLKADREVVLNTCAEAPFIGKVVLGNDNSPDQLVLSGETSALQQLLHELKIRGVRRAIPLKVSGAFHSPLMATAHPALAEALAQAPFQDARFPVITNVDGLATQTAEAFRDKLTRQLLAPVQWRQSALTLSTHAHQIIELGPGKVLAPLVQQSVPSTQVLTISTRAELESLR